MYKVRRDLCNCNQFLLGLRYPDSCVLSDPSLWEQEFPNLGKSFIFEASVSSFIKREY